MLECRETADGRFTLHYADGTRFHVDPGAASIWVNWPEGRALDYAVPYLLGPVMAFMLRLRGRLCLHASAVMVGDRSVLFVGPAGVGKSTLAAAFAHTGSQILSDDLAVLDDRRDPIRVWPGYPQLRLLDDAVRFVSAIPENLPWLAAGWDKRAYSLEQRNGAFRRRSAKLGSIFILSGRRKSLSQIAQIRNISGAEATAMLVGNTSTNYLLDRAMRVHEFDAIGRLARAVPTRELVLREGEERLDETCDWIRRHAFA